MRASKIKMLCYAENAVLIAETEDDLQRHLFQFYKTAKTYNRTISTEKTKFMTTTKIPIRCKLCIDNKIIQQGIKFMCVGIEMSDYGNIEAEVRSQATKATRTAACLNNVVWRSKHIGIEPNFGCTKKRPIMTYRTETRSATDKPKRILETTETRIGKMLYKRKKKKKKLEQISLN